MRTLKNNELMMVRDLLTRLNGLPSIKVAYASAKTIQKINNELRDLEAIQSPDPDFRIFQTTLEEVKKRWARKRANGEPATRIDLFGKQSIEVYDIPLTDMPAYQAEAEALEVENQEIVNRQKVKEANYNSILLEDAKVEFHKLDTADVKQFWIDKKITGPQFLALAFLMKKPVIKMEMIPEDVSQADMMALVEYFEI